MSGVLQNCLSSGAAYPIENSVRFRSAASAAATRTPGASGNTKTFVWSGWVKRGGLAVLSGIFGAGNNATAEDFFRFDATDHLQFLMQNGTNASVASTQVFRDTSAWYHVILGLDTTQAVNTNRVIMIVNGTQLTPSGTPTWPALNAVCNSINVSGIPHVVGAIRTTALTQFLDGYLADIRFIDGYPTGINNGNWSAAALAAVFGQVDVKTGAWTGKDYTGTFGANGFYLKFNSGSSLASLCADVSGNGNNFTASNLSLTAGSTYDWMLDTPANNFSTLNGVTTQAGTLKNGNLHYTAAVTTSNGRGSLGMTSGKWYWEFAPVTASTATLCGICNTALGDTIYPTTNANAWCYLGNGQKSNGSASAYGASFTNTNTVGVAFDADAGTLEFFKDGASQGVAFTGIPAGTYFPVVGQTSAVSIESAINFGQRPFAYTPPTGFKKLCTGNLPTPGIKKSSLHFDAIASLGSAVATGAAAISQFGNFSADFAWVNVRIGGSPHLMTDVAMGFSNALRSNTGSGVVSYASYAPPSGDNCVTWGWKAGGNTQSDNSGTVTSQVSANVAAGVSIVDWTIPVTDSTPFTVGHGLTVPPEMIIAKSTGATTTWFVWHKGLGNTQYLALSLPDGPTTSGNIYNAASNTASVFAGGNSSGWGTGLSYRAYCFASAPGFSKFDSYTGNGSTDGPFVYTGFRPKWLMVRRVDATGGDWQVLDAARSPNNVAAAELAVNTTTAEGSGTELSADLLSNGFKLRGTAADSNASGVSYVYAAFAEIPINYANAR